MFSKLLKLVKNLRPAKIVISPHIKVENIQTCSVITLDRKPVNAINLDMYHSVLGHLQQYENEKSHIIFKGSNGKFSAGGDVKAVISFPIEKVKDVFSTQLRNFELVSRYKIPTIGLMDGICMGGASPFSVACKYSVATGRTIYAMPETAIGFFNDAGASYFLSRLPMNIGLYIGLTGARVKGYDMKNAGLATHFVESSKLPHLEKDLINCKNDESIVQILNDYDSKEEVNDSMSISMNIERIDKTFDGQTVEEIYDNLHLEGSDFSMATIRILNSMSPTSLKVTHQSIMNGKHLSLHDCLRTEYRLAYNFNTKECDFKEGTRAVLIDKDNKPKWHPSNIKDVKNIEKFFEPLPNQEELTF